jgi:lanosterol synthase
MAGTRASEAARASGRVNGHTNGVNGNGNAKIEGQGAQKPLVRAPKLSNRTDYTRWRLSDERGRQTWHYLEDEEDAKEWPQSTADKYFLGLPTVRSSPPTQCSC